MKQVIQRFLKGINRRLSVERGDDPERLYTLQNARLQSRGATTDVTRIKGAAELSGISYDSFLDMVAFEDSEPVLLVLYKSDTNEFSIDRIRQSDGVTTTIGTFTATDISTVENSKLLVLEDTVLISPYNKQLNYINGTWFLNDFKSTTPLFTVSVAGGSVSQGSIQVTGDAVSDAKPAYVTVSGVVVEYFPNDSGVYRINIGGNTKDIVVHGNDTPQDIADTIVNAINADQTINNLWTAVYDNVYSSVVQIISMTDGTVNNGVPFGVTFISGIDLADFQYETETFGGVDEGTTLLGSIYFLFSNPTYNKYYHVITLPIMGGESANSIRDKIASAIESVMGADYTTTSLAFGSVLIVSDKKGGEYNLNITTVLNPTGATLSLTNLTGGTDVGGNLKENTTYHYKARYVYFDGHKTVTNYPVLWKTSFSVRKVALSFTDIPFDLDGNSPDIEIFRREEGGDWFLIDRVTPIDDTYVYVDDGVVERGLLDEQNYVWSETHQTHEIVRDRYVRANLNYATRSISDSNSFTVNKVAVTQLQNEQDILPANTNIDIYVQARYEDGLTSFHKRIGSIRVGDEQSILTITGSVAGAKETAYFAKIQPTSDEIATIPFNSVEIYNSHVASIESTGEAVEDKPINPHIFLGYKYISARSVFSSNKWVKTQLYVYDSAWDTSDDPPNMDKNKTLLQQEILPVPPATEFLSTDEGFPPLIQVLVSTTEGGIGRVLTYRRKYIQPDKRTVATKTYTPSCVYELAYLSALKEAVRQGNLQLELISANKGLSSIRPLNDYIGTKVSVVGILDTSETDVKYNGGTVNDWSIWSAEKNHLYLQIETGSVYDDFDNASANSQKVKGDWDGSFVPDFSPSYEFRLLNVRQTNFGGTETLVPDQVFGNGFVNVDEYTQDYGLTSTLGLKNKIDGLIYLGTAPNVDNLGFTVEKTNKFVFYKLKPSNIYTPLIEESDLQLLQNDYPNQIIWSESYVLGSNASGTRNFTFSNFLNVEQTYGKIVYMAYILNNLLVFCERGVAVINVGEVITKQVSGQVVVDSSTLLNGYYFALRDLTDVKPKSVVKYENVLFFGDGIDVWMYDGQFKNISSGAVTLSRNSVWVGGIDPFNKEYIITDGTNTYAYSIELSEWFGTWSFAGLGYTNFQDKFFGELSNKIVQHNVGNTMNGTPYDTVVESVANDLGAPHDVKMFRKFYIETTDAEILKYGKSYGVWQSKSFASMVSKNGQYHVGILPSEHNSTKLFWRIESTLPDFNLRSFATEFSLRMRR